MLAEFRAQQSLGALAMAIGTVGSLVSGLVGLLVGGVLSAIEVTVSPIYLALASGSCVLGGFVLLAVLEARSWATPQLGTRYFQAYQLVISTLLLLLEYQLSTHPDPIEARAIEILEWGASAFLLASGVVYVLVCAASATRPPLGTVAVLVYAAAVVAGISLPIGASA